MRILCCYANLRTETAISIAAFAPHTELIDVTGQICAYWRNIRERWNGLDDLMIIEQDIVLTGEVIPSFLECREPWCVYGYNGHPVMGRLESHLGCTKFSKKLQEAIAPETIASDNQRWDTLDGQILIRLRDAGYKPHLHGYVQHLHEYDKEAWSKVERVAQGKEGISDLIGYMSYFCAIAIDPELQKAWDMNPSEVKEQ